jgi:formate-dependent nitrite reductase membrane component NrfD
MSKGKTINADDSRVNVVLRLVGVIVFVLGVIMTYETFVNAGADVLQPPLVPVLYLCSGMLVIAGFVALIAKYKPSGGPTE